MKTPALNNLYHQVKSEIGTESDKKFVGLESIITILVYQGLKIILPEIKEWAKLGFSAIVLKRLEIEKRLKDFALEKELDYKNAGEAAEKIAKNINETNIKEIIKELELK